MLISLSEGGISSVLIDFSEGGEAFLHINLSERDVACCLLGLVMTWDTPTSTMDLWLVI